MLIIDDNMFRLAKMQETLLKVSNVNREENLSNYKQTVSQIDTKAYSCLLEEIKHIDEHNQSLESELEFLENIKKAYEQLLELQQSFKKICEWYGKDDLKLSDLSQLNIEYIENRINAINGYLLNIKNIETNKIKIQELNEELIDEEKKKIFLDSKLLDLEHALRENFLNAEGRYIVDGKLIPTSVVLEYKKIGLDFNQLLIELDTLDGLIIKAEEDKKEITEKLRTAEICYNSMLNVESKQILEEIRKDELRAKYQLTMLKILKFLSQNCNNYEDVKEKRENLLELIKYRLSYLEGLGNHISIDPFGRTKVKEQLDIINSLTNNTEIINKIRKHLSELNSRTEEMISQNNNYLISLSDTKKLIENNISMNDIDITSIDLTIDNPKHKETTTNQVTAIKNAPSTLNMSIVNQKTTSVIKRVNQMINGELSKKEETKTVFEPDLVIVPNSIEQSSQTISEDSEINFDYLNDLEEIADIEQPSITENEFVEIDDVKNNDNISSHESEFIIPTTTPEITPKVEEEPQVSIEKATSIEPNNIQSDITDNLFETVTPFSEPQLFVDRSDENKSIEEQPAIEFPKFESSSNTEKIAMPTENIIEMPQAFWPTQDTNSKIEENDNSEELSFDEQVNILMSTENTNKTLKKVA